MSSSNPHDTGVASGRLHLAAAGGDQTADEVAAATGRNPRLVREWLGGQAAEARLRAVSEEAGFSQFRRATETPLNLILEAEP